MKNLMVVLLMGLSLVFPLNGVQAQEKSPNATNIEASKASHVITVKVNGLVCAFCAQGIKKRFMALAPVQDVQVSLSKKTVVLSLKPQQALSDKTIQDTVKEAGYTTVRIER